MAAPIVPSSGGRISPDEGAGAGIGEFTGGHNRLAGDDGLDVAGRALDEATSPAGKIVHQFGVEQAEVVEVDEVQVGSSTDGEHTSVTEVVERGRIAGDDGGTDMEPLAGAALRVPRRSVDPSCGPEPSG
jgi:hypothetical protein